MKKHVEGFSKLSKEEKINCIAENYFKDSHSAIQILKQYWNTDSRLQKLHDEFIENTISNYYLPFGIAPNFLINNELYAIPMAIEESSVVAAASKAAKFWFTRGGFKAKVINTEKVGQVHFLYDGDKEKLKLFFLEIKNKLFESTSNITQNMRNRGGGIIDIQLVDKTPALDNYFQLHCTFETLDAMGANFINSCLERIAQKLKEEAFLWNSFSAEEKNIEVVMSILSNYVPNCKVSAEVSCHVDELYESGGISGKEFAEKFVTAVKIAHAEPFRAVTHNKGIMNGIDAVVIATGNDFRAIEAGIHAYASRSGRYASLSDACVENGIFRFQIEIPLAIGTIGGLTTLHPLVKFSLEMLHNPSAKDLMQIIAVAGLAQNFAAVKSLTTTGIQKGHMKMHLLNILNQLHATEQEKNILVNHYKDKVITHNDVVNEFNNLRKG